MNRQITRVAVIAMVLLAALILGTTYWQAWAAPGLADRQDNSIQRVAEFQIDRGKIIAGDGTTVLADNVKRKVDGKDLFFRRYPQHGLAAHIVGYSTTVRSRAGLEASQNDFLTGSNTNLSTVLDTTFDKLKGTTIQGNDLHLTLQPDAQRVALNALGGKCGAAVAIEPKTGRVLVAVSSPTYDPNLIEGNFEEAAKPKFGCPPLLNRAAAGLYTPGSTFKVVTASAALDSGRFTPSSTFFDPGYCIEYGDRVNNYDTSSPFGTVTLAQAMQHSINSVFCNIGKALGGLRIVSKMKRFGFYSVPPLETPVNERAISGLYNNKGRLVDPKSESQVDPGRLAFGQGPETGEPRLTPLQMAMVAATIANGGMVPRPYVVERVVAPDGSEVTATKPDTLGRAVSREPRRRDGADDGGGSPRRNRDGRANPGHPSRRQDRNRRERGRRHEHDLLHGLRSRRQPARGSRRHPRAPERDRRHDGGADRQADHGSADPVTTFDTLINMLFDGRYRIVRKLGSGGMADVYLAEDEELGRRIAIKILNDRHANDESFVERFRREAKNAAGLSHPNIVSIYDRGEAEGTYYIAMEYLDGRSLKELVVARGPLPIPDAIDATRQVLAALRFAHRKGVVHRDIKPHNVMADADGRLKVTDFGIARAGVSQMTEAGSIIGTAQYLSPEQARGAPVDQRSDLYSVGVVLYEMLTGTTPFSGESPVEIAMKHLSDPPRPPSVERPDIPPDLDMIVLRALAKNPDDRFQTAEEMDAELERVSRGVGVTTETADAATAVLSGAALARRADLDHPASQAAGHDAAGVPIRRATATPPSRLAVAARAAARRPGRSRRLVRLRPDPGSLGGGSTASVPFVVGQREDLAVQNILEKGLELEVHREPHETVKVGVVFEQSPDGGVRVDKGGVVDIRVSTGPPRVEVPDVVGRSRDDAIAALTEAKLKAKPATSSRRRKRTPSSPSSRCRAAW